MLRGVVVTTANNFANLRSGMASIPVLKDLESRQRRIEEQHIRNLAEKVGGRVLPNDLSTLR